MAVPTYDKFIEPVLCFLKHHPEGVAAKVVHEGAAELLGLDENQRSELVSSGQLIYKNRSGWAHDRLKRAGLSQSLSRGKWCLTDAGLEWIKNNPFPLSKEQIDHLAFDFIDVRLKTNPDAVPLDEDTPVKANGSRQVSSPDDRLADAVKEIRDAIAIDLLENLLQVSSNRFEVIVLDVLHKLGYGGHRDDLQRVGGTGDAGIDGIISLDKLGLERVYVQAKRWQTTVGRPELQAFYGALARQKAKRGIFITTSGYTAHAIDFAKSVEGLVLIDGKRLVNLMMDNEVGVSSQLIKLPKLDMDYFEQ
ncbi:MULTISPECIES: restriction endonuclease [unclassified Arsenophonus]|uniref:restriction endonuclease n=1 Tax=unclassified Arsenophonus TaxID=2627083 RepID=UPI00285EA1E5|nr:restriction endonuclease [Arsenophonus sp.]MDR5609203.1 restriction endonuclease [Arsenophonus sp.]MDR5612935.1 restriction endonuclease [Arsenophonus sp.]